MMGATTAEERRDALVGKLFAGGIESLDLLSVYLGDKLGLYSALAGRGALTPGELASAAGIHERYAREWLEQQAASGILDLVEESDDPGAWRFELPATGPEPLLKALIDGNAGIETLSIERPGLHDAFIAIAGEATAREMGHVPVAEEAA